MLSVKSPWSRKPIAFRIEKLCKIDSTGTHRTPKFVYFLENCFHNRSAIRHLRVFRWRVPTFRFRLGNARQNVRVLFVPSRMVDEFEPNRRRRPQPKMSWHASLRYRTIKRSDGLTEIRALSRRKIVSTLDKIIFYK